MSSKAYKIDQGATEMFISEFEYEESLRNVISEICKNGDAKKKQVLKDCLNYMRWVVINLNFSFILFAC